MAIANIVSVSSMEPEQLASNAGKECYESESPAIDAEKIDVKKRLVDTGHHTTLEHFSMTYALEDISVSTITYGLHLNHPFYNSDQRSGRFSKMYENPNVVEITQRMQRYYAEKNSEPTLDLEDSLQKINQYYPNEDIDKAKELIEFGIDVFQGEKESLMDIAADTLKKERKYVTDEYIERNANKMAQEQLRVFIPMVATTGMYHTIDSVTLASLWRVAWTPEMRDVVGQMKDAFVKLYPSQECLFDPRFASKSDLHFCADTKSVQLLDGEVTFDPELEILSIDIPQEYSIRTAKPKDSFDLLPFHPLNMNNRMYNIRTRVQCSSMTMGQDQRHRTIDRGTPTITGDFYLPPLLDKVELMKKYAEEFRQMFVDLMRTNPKLANFIVPYGMMAQYEKRANLNALIHEQEKRQCWCAQEEIYNMNRQMIEQLYNLGRQDLVDLFRPHCAKGGCLEGPRYCGRDINVWNKDTYGVLGGFKQRQI